MGNRAVIGFRKRKKGIYIHWNGGRDTVEPVLWATKNLLPENILFIKGELKRVAYMLDLLGLNPHIDDMRNLDCDNYDNGVYIVKDYEIVNRLYLRHREQQEYNFIAVVMWANENLPKKYQLSENDVLLKLASYEPEYIKNGEITKDDFIKNLNVGDTIYYNDNFFKLIGRNNLETPVNGTVRTNECFFNYTQHYEKNSRFKIDDSELECLMKNPNSYIQFDYKTNTAKLKIVDMEKYEQLKAEWEKIKAE